MEAKELTPRESLELTALIVKNLPKGAFQRRTFDYYFSHEKELQETLARGLVLDPPHDFVYSKSLADLGRTECWTEIWRYANWEFNPSGLLIPAESDGHDWLLGVPKDISANQSLILNQHAFECDCRVNKGDLDNGIKKNDRDPRTGAYFIRVRPGIQPDTELRKLSAVQLWNQKISGMTLTERLILGWAVYLISGKHLDTEIGTMCHGTRFWNNDNVPIVRWIDEYEAVQIDQCLSDDAPEFLGSRSVITQ